MGFVDRYKTPVKKRPSWKAKISEYYKDPVSWVLGVGTGEIIAEEAFKERCKQIGLKLIKGAKNNVFK